MYTLGDGTGRDMRDTQLFVRDALKKVWKSDHLPIVIEAAVGSGKSYLARMIQLEHGGAIITPQNSLLRQYTADYPDLNYWYGKHHFKCKTDCKTSCGYRVDELKLSPCAGCPLVKNRAAAANGEPTVFNPLSLFFLKRKYAEMVQPRTIIIDEAHAVLQMIMHMAGKDFDVGDHPNPEELLQGYNLVPWLVKKAEHAKEQMDAYASTGEEDKCARWERKYMRLLPVIHGVEQDETSYFISLEDKPTGRNLSVKPIDVPQSIVRQLFGDSRLILMSGTMFEPDIKELLGGREYHKITAPNPIPPEQRRIIFAPTPFKVNYKCDKADLACEIELVIDQYAKGSSVIVHLPYEWAHPVAEGMTRKVITHRKETKQEALEEFKATPGSILFACGMAEGIDLKGDLCRLNIIPKILWPNLGDNYVQKKRSRPKTGEGWYNLEAFKVFVQQTGRSTRGADDFSTIIVMDPSFPMLIKNNRKYLPNGFEDAIVWGSPTKAI